MAAMAAAMCVSLQSVPAVPAEAGLLPATCVMSGGIENWAELRKLRQLRPDETRLFIKDTKLFSGMMIVNHDYSFKRNLFLSDT